MAVNPITETISTIPTAGHRGVDVQTVFVNKQEAFQDTLTGTFVGEINNLKDQLNIMSGEINDTATQINTDADTASDARDEATTQAGIATTQAGIATTQAGIATTQAGIAQEYAESINPDEFTPRTTGTTANRLPKYSDTNGTLSQSNLYSNAGGDLGLDTTPSLWHASIRAFETKAGALFNYLTTKLSLIQNAYYSVGGIYFYKSTAPATMLEQDNGEFKFYTAPSGTSGTSVTFTEKVKIDNSGAILIATQPPQDNSNKVATTSYVDGKMVRGVPITASGTSIDFTEIPSWAKRITVMFNGVSTNGTSSPLLRVGTSGGITTTGYTSDTVAVTSSVVSGSNTTSGVSLVSVGHSSSYLYNGSIILELLSNNTWVITGVLGIYTVAVCTCASKVVIGSTLDRVRITTANGTDSFDSGQINIIYEG